MDLNMDLTDWVSCDSHAVSWQTNADDDVARCFFEQAEGGLHSTVVGKFPAGFKLPPHPHPGGEEVFVLEGSFLMRMVNIRQARICAYRVVGCMRLKHRAAALCLSKSGKCRQRIQHACI